MRLYVYTKDAISSPHILYFLLISYILPVNYIIDDEQFNDALYCKDQTCCVKFLQRYPTSFVTAVLLTLTLHRLKCNRCTPWSVRSCKCRLLTWSISLKWMSAMTSQITGVSIVYSTVCSGPNQRKHRSSASLAFVRGIHRWPVNSLHKGPVTRKMFPFDAVIMFTSSWQDNHQKLWW